MLTLAVAQGLPEPRIPNHEEAQPLRAHPDPRSVGDATQGLRPIRYDTD